MRKIAGFGVGGVILIIIIIAVAGGGGSEGQPTTPARSSGSGETRTGATSETSSSRPATPSVPRVQSINGTGDGVDTLQLSDGVWFCAISVSGNRDSYGGDNFAVWFHGRENGTELLANEIAASWRGESRVSVGDGLFDLSPVVDVEVTAAPSGRWNISCERQ